MSDPRDWPGAARDKAAVVAELAEVERVVEARAPVHAWCTRMAGCRCWRCSVLRICRYGVR